MKKNCKSIFENKKSLEEWVEDSTKIVEQSEDIPVGRLCGKDTDGITQNKE